MDELNRTHEVFNQFHELTTYNLFSTDNVLNDFIKAHKYEWVFESLQKIGKELGRTAVFNKANDANVFIPILKTHDARGNRIDSVSFHPSWYWFMAYAKRIGLVSRAYQDDKDGRWAYCSASFLLQSQIEAGALCPVTMTQASIPVLQKEPKLWDKLADKLLSNKYDDRDIPIDKKESIWIGMGMTEKQGGSDVRSNTTIATPLPDNESELKTYSLRGHKWFFSAPMCDAHLVVALTSDTDSLACFFVPRWKPNGEKNSIYIQRLKDKVGNKSNSSSEVEFLDAWGILIGKEDRGIPTIIEMATYTRLNCVLGSAAIIRQSTVQSINYARKRKVFGKLLIDQPLMRSVLVDLALESEAATLTAMHLSLCFEQGDNNPVSKAWKRVITPAAKFWICKKAIGISAEAMEVFGGNGYVEESIMGKLYREAPVNSIWEGSGNIMCLDVLRALKKDIELLYIIIQNLTQLANKNNVLIGEINYLSEWIKQTDIELIESKARYFTERLIVLVQACLIEKYSPDYVSELFINLKLKKDKHGHFTGSIDSDILNIDKLLERAFPAVFV